MDAFTITKENFSVENIVLKILLIVKLQFHISNNISKISRKEESKCLRILEVKSKL